CVEMAEALLDLIDRGRYDIVQFDKTEMAQYAIPDLVPAQLLVEHVVFYHAYRRQFLTPRRFSAAHLADYVKLRRYELDACRRFDGIITMSPVDTQFLSARLGPHPLILDVPNGVDTDFYRFEPDLCENHDLLFVGNFDHSPNVDGVRYFLREVFPQVQASAPDTRLFIVGPGPYHTLAEVASEPRAIPTGLVPDTRPYMERCSVFVAPILAGSGTRVKILEAMASGIPVVSTTVGAEGLGTVSGEHLLIADSPNAFAASVTRLLQDRELRERLRVNARRLVETHYGWETITDRLEQAYREVLSSRST
ncbi:MAG: glycosyltransferase, partial [Chloroflexota bacterium]